MQRNANKQQKRARYYAPTSFPFKDSINGASIHQQAHFVFNAEEMRPGFECLGDVNQSLDRANAKQALLAFISKGIKYDLHYRGLHAGATWIGEQPRVVILLNYLTKEVFRNRDERTPLSDEQLFRSDNIRGLLISIFIFDDALSFEDMLSDAMKINLYGLPQKKGPRDYATQPDERHIAPQIEAENRVAVGRPDVPGEHLDFKDTSYKYLISPEHRKEMKKKRASVNKYYTSIDRISKIFQLMQMIVGGDFSLVGGADSTQHLSTLGAAHRYQLYNIFTFEKALQQIALLDVDEIFKKKESWLNRYRVDELETFGAPSWPPGPMVRNFGNDTPQYPAGHANTCASLPLEMFRPSGIYRDVLPHISVLNSTRASQGYQQMDIDVATGRRVNISYIMESMGMPSAPRAMEIAEQYAANKDAFNEIADKNNATETRLTHMVKDSRQPSEEYKTLLAKHQEEGFRHYSRLFNDISSPDLPEGYRFMLMWKWKNPGLAPQEEPFWQDPKVALCSYSQMKVTQLSMFENIVQSSDSQLFVLPVLLRSCFSTYIGRYNTKIYREHVQVVCAPGTGKSDMISKLIGLLIEGTYEITGGASGMGLIGKHQSQRLIELSHELDGHYSPTEEPKGDAEKIHKMLLGCLSEGFKKYKTTGEVIDPITGQKSRQPVTMVSEDTNVRVGNRNWDEFKAKQCGSAYAMRDRFTTILMTMLYSSRRPSLLSSVLNVQWSSASEALISAGNQFKLMQDLFARYHAGMSVGYLPRADIRLYNSLNSLMTAFIATRYPNFLNALRSASTMNTRIIAETGMYAAWMTLFTPLNPTAKVVQIEKAKLRELRLQAQSEGIDPDKIRTYTLEMAAYNPEVLLPVMAKLYYCRYEHLVFVFTEKLFEMTNVVSLEITRHMAARSCRYIVFGHGERPEQTEPWPPETENSVRRGLYDAASMPLNMFVESLLDPAKFSSYLGMPASQRQAAARSRDQSGAGGDKAAGNDVAYNSYELVPEEIEDKYLSLYQTMAPESDEPFRIQRLHRPLYKREVYNNTKFHNPNYVCINASIANYARSSSGIFGHYKVDPDGFVHMMKALAKETMVTPYLPLIPESNVNVGAATGEVTGWENVLDRVQSLRYLPDQFRRFPKYRVPVLIEHETKECFYLLISYFETNPYKVCTEAINYISYNMTPRRRMLLGVPSQDNHYIYEPFTLKPRPGRELLIPSRSSNQDVTKTILSKYFFDPTTGRSAMGNAKSSKPQTYKDECLEEKYASDYLFRYFPDEKPDDLLENWGPAGVDRRLREFYTEHPDCLEPRPYPECIANPEAPIPSEKGDAFEPLMIPRPEKRAADGPRPIATNFAEQQRAAATTLSKAKAKAKSNKAPAVRARDKRAIQTPGMAIEPAPVYDETSADGSLEMDNSEGELRRNNRIVNPVQYPEIGF